MSRTEVEAKIEFREVIGEARPGEYQPIRFTRVKYKASPETHIDIRRFQRAYDDEGEYIYYPTKVGFRFLEREFRRVVGNYATLPEAYIHPLILRSCFGLLQASEFESAVLQAFKVIETTIRSKIGGDPDQVGVKLIRVAFHPETGPLRDRSLPKAEREAFAHYLAGAFGYYKNPCSHRDVEMDYETALERLVVASNLLKVVDRAGGQG